MALTDILSTAKSASSLTSGSGSIVGDVSAGATVGSVVPGVGTVTGGILGGVKSVVSSLFGGGSKPKDPTGDGGMANATAINQQRDTLRGSEIYQYYHNERGEFPSLGPGAGPDYLSPPGCDAFGNSAQVLRQLAEVIERLKVLIKNEPLVQKHISKVEQAYSSYANIGGVFGPMTGSGNVPEAVRNLNNVLRIVSEAERGEMMASQPAVPQITTAGSSASAGPGSAGTSDISALALLLQSQQASQQAFLTSLLEAQKTAQPSTVSPVPATSATVPAMAGLDLSALKYIAPILVVFLMFGFIFSNRGIGRAIA